MPIGVITDAVAVFAGGLIGAGVGDSLDEKLKDNLNMIFGLCSMGMGITSIVLMKNMPAVVLSLIVGTLIGIAIHFSDGIRGGVKAVLKDSCSEELITIIVLFCASGTGIYGALCEGMSGDSSILMAKAILDFFTALIFACTLKRAVALIAIPQAVIFLALFFLAGVIYPLCSETMICDFKACGGFIMLATGFRMLKLKMFPTADMIPGMILVMPMSWLWVTYVVPLL